MTYLLVKFSRWHKFLYKTQGNFRVLTTPAFSECEVVIPRSSVEAVSDRLANFLYGYFIGKRLALPIVQNYVFFNDWGKYGI